MNSKTNRHVAYAATYPSPSDSAGVHGTNVHLAVSPAPVIRSGKIQNPLLVQTASITSTAGIRVDSGIIDAISNVNVTARDKPQSFPRKPPWVLLFIAPLRYMVRKLLYNIRLENFWESRGRKMRMPIQSGMRRAGRVIIGQILGAAP